ncbi:helix-turn-helix transcriptional regulator [Kribbella pittospori]|uniref:Helix-turn-helix transcriptional regulator n=1 Tax=Kribbella pittospori TaxID=722689 RepID=A0A4R0KPY5_9ACTN|nr:LuxR C-terminal-related transcriptional regulator [Kribbella pittospori]TCC57965.1 helix-turn-helix transcriptional regulator [Kribbella pittospori]
MYAEAVEAGRAALSQGAWLVARAQFEGALEVSATPEAFEGLSWATWWLEDAAACLEAREQAYRLYRQAGDARGAARMALWLGDDHNEFYGAGAVAEGWFNRAARLLDELESCPELGWLRVFDAHAALGRHDTERARELAGEAREIGRRHGAVDLEMFSLATEGLALVEDGSVEQGMRCLDEATAAALGGEYENLAPAAWTCCRLMSACEEIRDYERGAQWCRQIEEFSRRMEARFVTGVCRAHYAAILSWHGRWSEAELELIGAREDLTAKRPFWRAEAVVRLAELRRRQGRAAEAAALFEEVASHPLARRGVAELCLDRDEPAAARDVLNRMLRRIPAGSVARAWPLELLVRAETALGDNESAAIHLAEFGSIAATVATPPLRAAARFGEGLQAAAVGDHTKACRCFEDAVDLFDGMAPFEAGHARLELARSLLALGRTDAARREARAALEAVAVPRRDQAELLTSLGLRRTVLSLRQVEVLRLIAGGLGDREIAGRLVISEHTVHRHVANIYIRLDCSTRAAAVSRATQLGLL